MSRYRKLKPDIGIFVWGESKFAGQPLEMCRFRNSKRSRSQIGELAAQAMRSAVVDT